MKKIAIFAAALLLAACSSPSGNSGGGGTTTNNEGSIASPVTLTAGATHHVKIGKLSDGQNTSYYQFTAASSGIYSIDAFNFAPSEVTGMTLVVHEDSAFSDLGASPNSNYVNGYSPPALTGGTTYYLELINLYEDTLNVTYDLEISPPE